MIGLLVHVSNKGEPIYGFFMFFVLALGLGLPYLFLGTFSGTLKKLPRSGEWMVTVRRLFGLVLLGMALYFLNPLLGRQTAWALVVLSAASAVYLILVEARRASSPAFAWLLGSLGAGLGLAAVLLIPGEPKEGILWEAYSEEALVQAREDGKTVMIDAYADWCLPCKELDEFTFTDPAVRSAAEGLVRLKLDLTRIESGSEAEDARRRFRHPGSSHHPLPGLHGSGAHGTAPGRVRGTRPFPGENQTTRGFFQSQPGQQSIGQPKAGSEPDFDWELVSPSCRQLQCK